MAAAANHEHATLLLQLYDLRREKVIRRARDFVQKDCKFRNYKDFNKRYPEGTKQNNYVGMVLGYWDMACTLVTKGLIDEDLFNSTTFEHVGVWFKFKPLAEAWRKEYEYPDFMRAMQTVAERHPGAAWFQKQQQPAKAGKSKDGASRKRSAREEGKKK